MRFLLGLALLVSLAGCLHSPAPAPVAPQSQAQETEVNLRVDIVDSTASAPLCVADFCGNVNHSFLLLPLEENQTLTGFDLTLYALPGTLPQPSAYDFRVQCAGEERCNDPLASASGPAPLHLEGHGLNLPGTETVSAWVSPADHMVPTSFGGRFTINGTLTVRTHPGPPKQAHTRPVSFDGIVGLCLPEAGDPNCAGYPSGTEVTFQTNGTWTGIHLRANWTAVLPADEKLSLQVSCRSPGYTRYCSVPDHLLHAEGPSPLSLDVDPLDLPPQATLAVSMYPSTYNGLVFGRESYHIQGTLTSLE
jgi:hypothetical protein